MRWHKLTQGDDDPVWVDLDRVVSFAPTMVAMPGGMVHMTILRLDSSGANFILVNQPPEEILLRLRSAA